MNTRKPPALANWLLNRFGLARQNPPLAGDLLEEFRSGRSAAWFWRQTLVVILTGLEQSARLVWRPLTGTLVAWAAQIGVAFVLWRLHFPRYLPPFWKIAVFAVSIFVVGLMLLVLWLAFFRKPPRVSPAVDTFFALLISYCVAALLRPDMKEGEFIYIQVYILFCVKVLMPGTTKLFRMLKRQ